MRCKGTSYEVRRVGMVRHLLLRRRRKVVVGGAHPTRLVLVSGVTLFACAAGCKVIVQSENSGGQQTVDQRTQPAPQDKPNQKTKAGVKIKQAEGIPTMIVSGPSGPIGVQPSATVQSELESQFPAETGFKWVGFITNPVDISSGDQFDMHFVVSNATSVHSIAERATFDGDSWSAGYFGEFSIGPAPSGNPALPGWAAVALAAFLVGAGIFVFGNRRREPAT